MRCCQRRSQKHTAAEQIAVEAKGPFAYTITQEIAGSDQ